MCFQNRQHLMANFYDIAPDWVSDRSARYNVDQAQRNNHWSWQNQWDGHSRPSTNHVQTQTSAGKKQTESSEPVIPINDVSKAPHNVPPPPVTPKSQSYKLPIVSNPMGPCLTQISE